MKKHHKVVNIHEKLIQKFIEHIRPPVEIRDKLDIGYSFDNYTVEIFEIRPLWTDETKKIQCQVAKSTYVKSRGVWKIFWKRANGNWDPYPPQKEVKELADFLTIVEEDKNCCFWG